ncbi:2-dehydro-3-deoxygalactonokinase [Paracoccus sp. CPCC 101403]|uniref:2-dehydro-3-deoxygalactonokinase n=1 Tax=Paracoccus broussonetiae TaxID=3075834 RepID=A0ABU3EF15_9RHOB|nr:2-dehydro-3-deoxygalactonokinase [Paracoccus sp. CPCC 101403]MDT1062828.1 2-dehydro-3-deoxygalactonokinase [Paracoccus sp. CPCC 101403]
MVSPVVTGPDWIAVDWGTTRLRVWAMQGSEVLDNRSSDKGMGSLTPEGFEPALLELVADWLGDRPVPVIACGMVGARTGWVEAEYRPTPCTPLDPLRATRPLVADPRLQVHILPGLSQIDPPDVLRGEETQIAGFLARNPDFEGTLCLPGTHCKWVRIASGMVEGFHTFMTGEVYALLSRQSVLRLTIGDARPDMDSFLEASAQAATNADMAPAGLFPLRAAALLNGLTAEQGAGRLSGLLIGSELAAARPLWSDRRVVIIGAPELSALYAGALTQAGADAHQMDGGELVLAGLTAAASALTRTT